jgi:hypothetical protein
MWIFGKKKTNDNSPESAKQHPGHQAVLEHLRELDKTAPETRPAAMGFALQRALDAGKDVLDPTLAADIVTEFAVPAAKFDPAKFR